MTKHGARRGVHIGLFLSTVEQQTDGRPNRWKDIHAKALACEEAGFDSLWVMDRLEYQADGQTYGVWESLSLLAALSAVTARVQLGLWVLNATYRNPALAAKAIDTLDEISGGRIIVGLGAGNAGNDPECRRYGMPSDHRSARFQDAFRIMRGLLGGEKVTHDGDWSQARGAELAPRGPRVSGAPIFVAARGPLMMREAAQYADGWAGVSYDGTAAFGSCQAELAALDTTCRDVGREPSSLERAYLVFIGGPGGEPAGGWTTCRGNAEQIAECLRKFANAGVTRLLLAPEVDSVGQIVALKAVIDEMRRVVR